ncbi:hypothetical protein HDR67_00975 [bacterium]|nr:hypothetical protein [bacterium]
MKENRLRKYLFENIIIDTDITGYSEVKNPSNRYSWEITKNGEIHALQAHPEIAILVPNYLEQTIETLKRPDQISKDLKYKNTTTFIRYLDGNHILRVSVLVGSGINKVKSIRYQSIKVKKKKELGRSA